MRRFISIKSKLTYLLLATIILVLLLVGISLSILIKGYYQEEADKGFVNLFNEVRVQLQEREEAVTAHAGRLSQRDEIVAAVNMIDRYANPKDYQPLVYDPEKRSLASELRNEAIAGNLDEIAIYTADGRLISFYRHQAQQGLRGYVSYDKDGTTVTYLDTSPGSSRWREAPLPKNVLPTLNIGTQGEPAHHYHYSGNAITVHRHAPIIRSYPNGESVVVGYVVAKKFLGQAFVEEVRKKSGVEFSLVLERGQRFGGLDGITPGLLGTTAAFSTTSETIPFTRHNLQNYFVAATQLELSEHGSALMLGGVPMEVVANAINNTLSMVVLALLAVAAIILPLGVLVANRVISKPLDILSEGVAAIEKGAYGTRVSVKGNDELGVLARAFNSMSSSICQREEELLAGENKYRCLVDNLPQRIFFKDRSLVYVSCNRRYAEDFGMRPEEVVGKTDFELFGDLAARKYREDDTRIIQSGVMEELEEPYMTETGMGIVQTVKTPIRDAEGKIVGILGIFWDITEKKDAENRLRQSAAVFESTADGVMVTDVDTNIIAVNNAFTEITGYSEAEALGQKPSFRQSKRQDEHFYQKMWEVIKQDGVWMGEIWNRRKSGEVYPEWMTINTVRDNDGNVTNYVAVFSDISTVMRSQKQLDHMAHHDPLTDLPNRTLLDDRLDQAINRARRNESSVAVLFIDLDRFKNVNDSLGHPTGDLLLQEVAKRLHGLLREEDTLARLGGDEFIVLIADMARPEIAEAVAGKMLDAISHPFTVRSQELYIGASIGISTFPGDGHDTESLIKHADAAMYRAKEHGRNTYEFYTEELTQSAVERLELESALRRAVERKELELYYQPKVNLGNGAIIGAEALLRWHHPERGMIPPDKFIPVAEENGMINEIGEWVLMTASRQAVTWANNYSYFNRIAINLSGIQVQRGDIVEKIRNTLIKTGLRPEMLELEITETILMQYPEVAAATLGGLRQLGVDLAIDDFGTGYSSLSYLKRFPLQTLKIDRSFIMDIPHDSNDTAITRAVIAMGKSLSLELVAEGVETEEQERFLLKEGCDIGQGYYYSRPLPVHEFEQLLSDGENIGKKITTP